MWSRSTMTCRTGTFFWKVAVALKPSREKKISSKPPLSGDKDPDSEPFAAIRACLFLKSSMKCGFVLHASGASDLVSGRAALGERRLIEMSLLVVINESVERRSRTFRVRLRSASIEITASR